MSDQDDPREQVSILTAKERYAAAVAELPSVPLSQLGFKERAQLRAVALRALRVYPGPAGIILAKWIDDWADFGYAYGSVSLTRALIADVIDRQVPEAAA